MKKREYRFNTLIKILETRQFVPINEMADLLHVSDMTIRRDFQALKECYPISMTNGILMLNQSANNQQSPKAYNLNEETKIKNDAKKAIGRFAASLIEPNDCIIFDTGSTTDTIIPHIDPALKLRILCFNFNILNQAQQNPNNIISFAGGYYHPETQMFESAQGIDFIHSFRANKVFISAAGIHEKLGITCVNNYEVPTKRAILQASNERILVADSGKFGNIHTAYFCDLSDIDTIITDNALSKEWISLIENRGIRLYLV